MKRNLLFRRAAALLFCFSLLLLSFSGCQKPVAVQIGKDRETMTLRWFVNLNGQSAETDRILQALQKAANLKLELTVPESGNQTEQLASLLSSGASLDLATLSSPHLSTAAAWAQSGLLHPVDSFLSASPKLSALLNSEPYASLKLDSASYLIPVPDLKGGVGYYIRADWLEQQNLSAPVTAEEFLTVCRAFTWQDPDQNGKDDTFGFTVNDPVGSLMFGYVSRAFGHCAANGEDITAQQDGSLVPFITSDAAFSAFTFLRGCYQEGVFNRDYASLSGGEAQAVERFCQSESGIVGITDPTAFYAQLQAAGLENKVCYLPPLNTDRGETGSLPLSAGFDTVNLLPASGSHPDWVAELLEWSLSEDFNELSRFGREGIHFSGCSQKENTRLYKVTEKEMEKDWNSKKLGLLHPLAGKLGFGKNCYLPVSDSSIDFENAQLWTTDDAAGTFVRTFFEQNLKYARALPMQENFEFYLTCGFSADQIAMEIEGRNSALASAEEDFMMRWLNLINGYNSSLSRHQLLFLSQEGQ